MYYNHSNGIPLQLAIYYISFVPSQLAFEQTKLWLNYMPLEHDVAVNFFNKHIQICLTFWCDYCQTELLLNVLLQVGLNKIYGYVSQKTLNYEVLSILLDSKVEIFVLYLFLLYLFLSQFKGAQVTFFKI